ncbi:MAG: Cna B-type domain-containing protein [Clostridia bacterium]|nr:Cna B-type domain-containing protein [Clostridia bacterium]
MSNVVLNKKITGATGSIALTKTDADTGEKLSGAVFTVYSDEACTTSKGTMTVKDATNNPGVYTMENLPAGTYYVKETAPEGYRQPAADHKYTVTVQAGKVINVANGSEFVAASATPITNKAITSVSVEKVWDDSNNGANKRPASIQVQLYNGNTPVGNPVNLPITLEDNTQSWSYTWNDLDKYVAGTNNEIAYTVDEVSVPDHYIKTVTTNGNAVTITNKYVAETEVTLSAKKTLNGADYTGDEFTFVLAGNNVNETVSSVDSGVVTFPKITYTLADLKNADGTLEDSATFTYTISEEEGSAAGVTYDDTIYTAVVTLTYNAQTGELEHSVAYTKNAGAADEEGLAQDEVPVFANTSIELVSVSVTKEWKHGTNISTNWPAQIQVVLTVDGVADYNRMVRLPVNNNDWSYTWPDLPKYGIDEEGKQYEIDYSVMENSVPNDYVSKLSAKAKNDYVITNTYVEVDQELELTFPVTKMVKGGTTDELFTFKLEARPSAPPAPMPEGAVLGINGYNYITTQTTGTAAGTTVNFDTIKVTSAKVKEHGQNPPYYITYGWKISEVIPENKNPNIIYDEGWYEILVNFCINEDGKLAIGERDIWDEDWENILGQEPDVTITHYDAEGNYTQIPYNDGAFALPFTNTYFAPTQVNLAAQKTLNDAAYDGTAYSFQLKKGNNIVETVTEADNGAVAFTPIEFTLADMKNTDGTIAAEKTFTYTISEEAGSAAGVTYDNTVYTAEVTVTCKVDEGTLSSEVVYKKDGTAITGEVPVFANTAEKVNVSVTKVWDDNNDKAKKRPESIQVQLKKDGAAEGDPVTLPYNGSWNYTWPDLLKYEEGKTEPIEYTVEEITTDGNGNELPWVKDYIPGEPAGDMENGFTITNTYVSAETEITLTKKLDGQPSKTEFDFTLTPKTEGDKNKAASANNSAAGGIVFSLAYGKADMGQTYVYEIAETAKDGYYCDSTVYTVTVAVGDEINADGTLPLTVTYTKGDKVVEAADLVFENASAITAELPVQKTLTTNVADVERTYRFTLTPEGATEAEQTIDVSVGESQSSDDLTGSNKFELSFAAPGTYTYTVAEAVASELPGYTYDESVYTVTYEVEMANGKLQMAAGYPQITLNGTAADELAFTNDYKQEAGSATIHANKVFTNGTLTDGQFTFELEDKDGKVVTATNNANGVVTFPDLHFDAVGEYDYTLREKLPADAATGGIVYDGKSVAVKVKVVKDGNQLTATVEYNNTATVPTFTNEQLKTTIELTANKVFTNGTLTDGQFTFELLDEAGTTPIKDASGQPITATNEADGSIVFPELTYTAPGEYKYTIKEQIPENQGNIAYDKASFPVTVTVTRVGNELKAEATYPNGAAEFTNEQLSTTGKVYVKKNFADNKTAAGDYTFTMTPVGDAPALTTNTLTLTFGDTTTEASGVFQLPTYTAPGTYTYTVEESTATKNANVEYDSTKYTVVVTVERVNDELVATVTSGNKQITEQEPIVFTNKVLTTSLSGTKVWAKDKETDRPEKITIRLLANGKATGDICELASDKTEWSFTDLPVNDENGEIIYTVSEDAVPGYATSISGTTITNTKVADGQAVIQARKVLSGATLEEGQFTFQLLDAGGNVVDTKTNDANGLITFTAITYDMDDMKGEDGKKVAEKAFTYTIKEVIPTPEEEGYTYDETEHPVTVTVTEDTTDHKLNATVDYGTAGEVVFTNTYSETEAILSVTKELVHSSDLPKAATFTFTLKDGKDKVLGSKPLTFDAKSESVQTVDFDKITYKTAGTYTYTVTETPAEDTAITSDATVYQVTVDVKATENGLQQTTTIKADGKDASAIKFTNTYNATVDVTGTKKWVGDNAAERPESITLTLYADGTEQTDKTPVFTDTDKDTWQWSFTDLPKYNAAGDAIIYTVSEDEVPGYVTEISGTTITNTKVADGQAVIKAKKTLNGAAPAEGQFTFQLLKDGKVVDTKTNDATGMVTFKTLEYSDEAEETYTIVEVLPAGATAENNYTVNGMTYDPAQHTAKVKVVQDDASKKLVATVTYDGTSTEAPEFTNTYTVTGTTLALSLSKTLENSAKLPEDRTETFTFVLADAAGATKDEATVSFTNTSDATQTVAFDTLTFDAEGTYNYTITETASTKDDIITDTTKYSLEVKVEDVNGQLVATKTLTKQTGAEEATSAEAIAFTNTYDFDKFGELTLNVTKAMSGRAFQSGDSFTFTVTGDNGAPMPEKTTVTIEPTSGTTAAVDFGKISYTEADVGKTYTYTIQETEPAEADKLPGVTYDTTEYTVTVKVTEGADALVVTPTYAKDGKVTITNTYENELTEIAVKKVWVETDPEQQAQRPASVDVQLYAGDVAVTGKVLTLNAANLWAGRFTDLPKYVTGTATPIAYTVKEITEGVTWTANYTTGEAEGSMTNGFTITNTNKHVATTEIAVTKVWVEANDEQQALRPTSVDVQLYADGVAVTGKVLTLTATDGWTGSFANLQKYVAGTATPINYTVKEVTDADWLTNYTPGEPVRTANGYTITNTSKHVAKTEIEVTKVWVEANDEQQAQRPASIQVQLYADNVAVTDQVLTLNEGNAWAGSFTDLVKYQSDNETLIAYTVKEITGDWTANYTTAAPAGDMATGYTITNTSKYVATTEIAVTKAWVETNAAQQALRPTSVDVQLYADGVAMADQVLTLTAADAWKGSFTDLVKYQSDNVTPIQYTVKEITEGASWLAYYTPGAPSGDMANGFTITNTSNYNANGKLLLTGTKTVTGDSTVAEHTFTFGVFDQSGKEVATGTNDATGNITFTEIAYTLDQVGSHMYTVKETATVAQAVADKYIVELDETEYTILVNVVNNAATGNLDVTWSISQPVATKLAFTNDFQLRVGNIGVVKVDSKDTTKGLSGAEFTVYTDEACTTVLMLDGEEAIITTGATGAGALDGLPIGTYWVKETKAPQHYLLDEETVYEVTVVEGDRAMVNGIHVTNKKMAKLALEKSDRLNPDKKLPDAEYTLFTEEDCEEEDILVLPDGTEAIITTGEDGVGELEGVPAGTYWVKETKAPTGYEVDPIPYKVIVPEEEDPENPVFVAVSDFPLRGALSLSKTVVASSEVTDTFLFDIELTLETDDPIVGSYKATLNGAETENVTFTATETGAKATVELKDGETMSIIGLRAGVSYTVTEQPNSRYDVTVNGVEATSATGTISDTALSIVKYQNTLKETGFTVEKVWLGEDAGEIKLTLYANGVAMDPQPAVTREGNTYSYADLVMKDENGAEIVYTVKETAMAGYTTSYENAAPNADKTDAAYNGGKIINQAMTTFAVKKEWSGLAEGEKAPAIQLTLYCNGKVYTAATPTPDKDGWYTYADLPAYVDGQLAVYTVKEEPVTGFTTTYINKGENAAVTDCAYNGSTIVNSKIPQTGDKAPLTLWMLTTLLAACGLMGVMATLRKREN